MILTLLPALLFFFATSLCNAEDEGFTDAMVKCGQTPCPENYTNGVIVGFFCVKPSPYGVGVGYAWQFGDGWSDAKQFERCRAENPLVGCEKVGLIVYPKCREGYKKAAGGIAFMCDKICPEKYMDVGMSCKKPCATA